MIITAVIIVIIIPVIVNILQIVEEHQKLIKKLDGGGVEQTVKFMC